VITPLAWDVLTMRSQSRQKPEKCGESRESLCRCGGSARILLKVSGAQAWSIAKSNVDPAFGLESSIKSC
jgi:hypothetical protein